jgi:hypothetical protein
MTTLVRRLLTCGCPAAVFFCVVAIYVNSVNASALWSVPHVLEKVFKSKPPVAYLNPSSTVQVKLSVVGVSASLLHSFPASVSSVANAASLCSHPVLEHSFGANFRPDATTTFSFPVSQFTDANACGGAAVALAQPVRLAFLRPVKHYNNKPPVPLASGVNFVVASTWDTSTRLGFVARKRIGRDCCFVAAFTFTSPFSSARRIIIRSPDDGQLIKDLPSKVFEFAHCYFSLHAILADKGQNRKAVSHAEDPANVE